MTVHATTGGLDALRPASTRTVARILGSLPSAPRPAWWVGFALLSVAMTGANVAVTRACGAIVDALGDTGAVVTLIAAVAAGLLIQQAAGAVVGYLAGSRLRILAIDLRRACLAAVLRAPVPRIQELGTGNVVTRLTSDIDKATQTLTLVAVRVVSAALLLPFTLVALMLIGWPYAIAVLVVIPLFSWLIFGIVRAMPPAVDRESSAAAARNNALLDVLRGLPTLRAFGLGDWGRARAGAASWRAVQATADVQPIITRAQSYTWGFYYGLLITVIVLGTGLHGAGLVTLGAAVSAVLYVSRLELAIFDAMQFASDIQNALTCLGRAVALAELDDAPGGPGDPAAAPADLDGPAEVRIDGLTFTYPGTTGGIFDGLDLTLLAGEATALVGTSGAGKSTLAGLIAGLYVPDAGTIRIGGHDTAVAGDAWTARQVTLLSQETHLFAGTLREDLRLAAGPGATDADLEAALATAGLAPGAPGRDRYLTAGLDTPIGAHAEATGVAPAVAQHIALARIVLRDPPVLIMDEATAEAGSEDAEDLTEAAGRIARGRTSLIVAHRLDQAAAADRVLVMEHGSIVEDGTHADLLAANGRYRRLWDAWNSRGTAT